MAKTAKKTKSVFPTAFYSFETIITATAEQKRKSLEFCEKMEKINELIPGRQLESNNKKGKTSASGKMAEFAVYSLLANRIAWKLKPGEKIEDYISEPSTEIHHRAVFDVDIPTKTKNWHIKVCRGVWEGDLSWFWKKRDPHIALKNEPSEIEDWFIFLLERKDLGEGSFQVMWAGQIDWLTRNNAFQETNAKNRHSDQCVVTHSFLAKMEQQAGS